MRKILLCGLAMFSLSVTAQQKICGFDETLKTQDKLNPGMRSAFDKIIQQIHTQKKNGAASIYNKTVNGIYEIPVVVHVIYPTGAAVGSTYNKTDAQIQAWLERANQMYAGTYAWPSTPTDFGTSAAFPIKLVLAKRDPNCNATTGIVRYDGGSLPNYNTSGVRQQTSTGATTTQVKSIAPHWPEASYFNIYIVSMFDGDTTPNAGLMGWAAFPNNLDTNYESFMKSGVVTNTHDTTLAHEFGHAMGLYHTFQDGNYAAQPGDPDFCPPTTGVCEDDDDMVCDTERAGSGYLLWPVPTNSQLNPCTGVNYQGVQYNMMNYSNSVAQKFTAGQGDRIEDLFMLIRSSLTTSTAATDLPATPVNTTPIPAICNPTGVNNPSTTSAYLAGPTFVKLGQIDNSSAATWAGAPEYYVDYTTKACFTTSHTPLAVNQQQTVQVGFLQATSVSQSIRVWIDYNNNGTFEASELVASGNNVATDPNGYGTFTGTFTPPSTAVMNTPLRMRVLADIISPSSFAPCGQLGYGQVEDYSVTLVSSLATTETKADNDDWAIYPNPSVTGDKIFIKAKNAKNLKVVISDMSGRLIATPSLKEESNGTFTVNQSLEKGIYMVQISSDSKTKTSKLIIK
ncbi:GEVED domain-containing protein [Chryseobacterium sp.]|uniref:GEVED domain-containing protein n=1 Tax=Chryseobacterium sp. TaxID=1871047 RepID=UPI0025BE59FA|nr:GEVED domain-containing protein [Chryseobacterium sp.]